MTSLKRVGSITKTREGSLVLVNEKREGYAVDELVAFIWSKADGKTRDELVKNVASELNISEEEIKSDVNNIVDKLKDAELLRED